MAIILHILLVIIFHTFVQYVFFTSKNHHRWQYARIFDQLNLTQFIKCDTIIYIIESNSDIQLIHLKSYLATRCGITILNSHDIELPLSLNDCTEPNIFVTLNSGNSENSQNSQNILDIIYI